MRYVGGRVGPTSPPVSDVGTNTLGIRRVKGGFIISFIDFSEIVHYLSSCNIAKYWAPPLHRFLWRYISAKR